MKKSNILFPFNSSEYDVFLGTAFGIQSYSTNKDSSIEIANNGTMTVHNYGSTTVTLTKTDGTTFSFVITVLLPNGDYFIKNRHTANQRYITIDDNEEVNVDGAFMELWSFTGEDRQLWEIMYVSDGYYNIISKASGKYLLINSNQQTTDEEHVRQGGYVPNSHYQQWKITLTDHGSFKIANRATIEANSNLVMCMGQTAIEDSNGVNVENRPYVDNESYRDEWIIENISPQDYYEQMISRLYGFNKRVSQYIVELYYNLKNYYPNDSNTKIAWRYSRLLGGLYYNDYSSIPEFAWNDVCGDAISNETTELSYFMQLGFTETEYTTLKQALSSQHSANGIDFAHMNMAIAGRLAYLLDEDGLASNIAGGVIGGYFYNSEVSYLAGWLGDAVLTFGHGNSPIFKNDDYMADLDAENIYRLIADGENYFIAMFITYMTYTTTNTRADVFLGHISYSTVESLVMRGFFSSNERENLNTCYETLRITYNDTYAFLCSLSDSLHEMGDYT